MNKVRSEIDVAHYGNDVARLQKDSSRREINVVHSKIAVAHCEINVARYQKVSRAAKSALRTPISTQRGAKISFRYAF